MEEHRVKGTGQAEPISNANYSLKAPGLVLKVKDHGQEMAVVRSESGIFSDGSWEKACGGGEVKPMRTFEIDIEDATQAAGKKRSDGSLEMTTAAPMVMYAPTNPRRQTAMLHEDESGQLRWVLPQPKAPDAEVEVFELPPVRAGKVHRGAVTKKIRRVVKVIAWVTDAVVGHLALNLVRKWEESHRPYGLLGYDNGQLGGTPNWDRIKAGKSLLLLHGTFSTGDAAFDGMFKNQDFVNHLNNFYQGRVFAFNHPSLHVGPAGNIQRLQELLPPEMRGKAVDIITHSRGGLVGRELCAQTAENKGPGLQVDKAIFVAGPHRGTILTDKEHWMSLIDTYTNLLTSLPDNVVTILLEVLISLVKIIGGATVDALPGLQAMLPEGDYVKSLEQRSIGNTTAYTMSARYLPSGDGIVGLAKSLALKVLLKGIFKEDSDMVVPTDGALTLKEGSSLVVPAERQLLYESDSMIHHINFFNHERVNRQLGDWLTN